MEREKISRKRRGIAVLTLAALFFWYLPQIQVSRQIRKEQEEAVEMYVREEKEENKEENKEETEEKASTQQNPDDKNEQQNPEEKETEEQKEETIEPEPVEEEKTSAKDSQEETPSAFADVDDIKNSKDLQSVLPNEEELKNFTSGITVGDNLNANSSRIHEEYEKMSAELENSENPEVEEEKGRTL